jgi:hypothetical protein
MCMGSGWSPGAVVTGRLPGGGLSWGKQVILAASLSDPCLILVSSLSHPCLNLAQVYSMIPVSAWLRIFRGSSVTKFLDKAPRISRPDTVGRDEPPRSAWVSGNWGVVEDIWHTGLVPSGYCVFDFGRLYFEPCTSVQKAIRKAAKEAGIEKPIGPHTFRHSFATHLLQAGTNVRKIQELLGHQDLKTTMIYTHIAGLGAGIKSPLDSLDISDPPGL